MHQLVDMQRGDLNGTKDGLAKCLQDMLASGIEIRCEAPGDDAESGAAGGLCLTAKRGGRIQVAEPGDARYCRQIPGDKSCNACPSELLAESYIKIDPKIIPSDPEDCSLATVLDDSPGGAKWWLRRLQHVLIHELLHHCKKLETLELDGAHISDEAVVYLERLPNLRVLSVASTEISDGGLDRLAVIPTLEILRLDVSDITPARFARFKKRNPKLTIE